MKPYSQACENNKQPILSILKELFKDSARILEIGSGTGQHGVYFAENMPHLFWQTSDQDHYHDGILQWIASSSAPNLGSPLSLDVMEPWPEGDYDGVFSANTAHIMSWQMVVKMFEGVGRLLPKGGKFGLYGPFNRSGEFTSPSNERFHYNLLNSDPDMGIRDDRAIFSLAESHGLENTADHAMPANNRLLVFIQK